MFPAFGVSSVVTFDAQEVRVIPANMGQRNIKSINITPCYFLTQEFSRLAHRATLIPVAKLLPLICELRSPLSEHCRRGAKRLPCWNPWKVGRDRPLNNFLWAGASL